MSPSDLPNATTDFSWITRCRRLRCAGADPVIADATTATLRSVKTRLARGAASAFIVNILGTAVAFLSHLVLARALSAQGYGVYAYVMAWVTVLALLATLGFQTGLLRFASAYCAREEWQLLRGVIRYAMQRVSLAGLVIGIATAGVVVVLGDRVAPELRRTFLVGCAIVPLLALLDVRGSLVRAFGGVVWALTPQMLVRHGVVLVVVGSCVLASFTIQPHSAMAVMLLATLLGLVLVSLALRWLRPPGWTTASVAYDVPGWRRASLAFLFMAMMRALLNRIDLLMLGMLTDTASVGVYAVATRVADVVSFALVAINVMFAPSIAALHARSDRVALQAMVTTTAWWAAISALLIGLPLFALAGNALALFGEAFTSGTLTLRILLVGQIVNAAAGSVGPILTMTGHERQAATVPGITALGQVALNAALIPSFGMEGAAVATTIALISWNTAMAVLVWKNLNIMPSLLARR
jgi:O-antigen/teichoic acid export membrane protein